MTRYACACLGASACACILALYILIGLSEHTDEAETHRGDMLPTFFMAIAVLGFFVFFLLAYTTCLFSARIWRHRHSEYGALPRPDDVLAIPLVVLEGPDSPDTVRDAVRDAIRGAL